LKVSFARWKVVRGKVGRVEGWVGALKALWEGGLRQMSVPGGAERVKGGMVVVVVDVEADMVARVVSMSIEEG
jgi:hypothetical protein